MRTMFRAAAVAALCLVANATGATADGWGESTIYRNSGWASATPDVSARTSSDDDDHGSRRARVSDESDEDRPQRRSRTARAQGSSIPRGSIAGGSRSGGSVGMASYYWQPQRVASGGWFNPNAMTAAHKTLPFGTRVRVTHTGNGRSVDVTINDRGPYIAGRIIDLSKAAASAIRMTGQGVAQIRMTVLGR